MLTLTILAIALLGCIVAVAIVKPGDVSDERREARDEPPDWDWPPR